MRVTVAILLLTTTTTAIAANDWSQGVVVSAKGESHLQSRDDRAIYACAQTMMHEMFPDATRIRVVANPRDRDVFNSSADSALPGVEMAVLLQAADPETGKPLGTAECHVSSNAKVSSLKPGVKDLPPAH